MVDSVCCLLVYAGQQWRCTNKVCCCFYATYDRNGRDSERQKVSFNFSPRFLYVFGSTVLFFSEFFFVTRQFRWVGSHEFLAAIIYGFYISFYVLDADAYVQASATMFGCDGGRVKHVFLLIYLRGLCCGCSSASWLTNVYYITIIQKVANIRDKSFA